ncbi:glycoside hydrolase family 3 C-terminal domain-containing protein [Demequina salsinemoris]|uniref:glycoside hydrolase family 3 C-terminal domain-containing protein n=1 Tax=Demequina salsinemoris TaxID=577470 RepID=UPI0007804E65|nr:glycoside hydrolase family 3 C-terminal domain-containing protein [Demequina salsinemoris]
MDPADLPLEQRIALGAGSSFWTTASVDGLESIRLSDGPHGVRRQTGAEDHLGAEASLPSTCFPTLAALAQTWDPETVERVGQALAEECQALDVQVLLGPGVNIRRSPLGGRNFEYLSEDPHVSGALGTAWVRAVQSRGVGASLKHFALNNQENDRMRVSADIDPRPMREVYLRPFRRVVEDADPWTVMCSYNRVNGVPVSHDPFLLTRVLRDEWGYDGVVVSDWGAVKDRVASVVAGLDLQMPGDGGASNAKALDAALAGRLDEQSVNRAARHVARLVQRAREGRRADATFSVDLHHEIAREAATRAIVLLKNEGGLLPLADHGRIAVIGEFARTPRYQGGGSSHVNPTRLDVPLDEIRRAAPHSEVTFAPGFTLDDSRDGAELAAEAVAQAREADVAVVMVGLDARQESEGFDRDHLGLPADQLELLAAVAAEQPRVVAVVHHGGTVLLNEVAEHAGAVLDAGLLGQAGASAVADVLTGTVNPSGKLTETVPLRLEDTPAFLDFPGEHRHARYAEGLFVGYRWYDARCMEVAFPFGHGLSYTTFAYGEATAEIDGDSIIVSVSVTNTGTRAGREVVQAYVSVPDSAQVRVPQALAGFASVELAAGEERAARIVLDRRDLEYWDVRVDRFVLESGRYDVALGSSSRDLRARTTVELQGDDVQVPLTLDSTMGEVMDDPSVSEAFRALLSWPDLPDGVDELGMNPARVLRSIPLRQASSMGGVPLDEIEGLLSKANAPR